MSPEPKPCRPPCILFEDDDLLVVNKPAGMNTHAPGPFAGEGLYDWLRHREQGWASLAIIHRLDKETSGVLVFAKSAQANRSLTAQFTARTVRKKYVLLAERSPRQREFVAKSRIARAGERYVSAAQGDPAETRFRLLNSKFKIQNSKLIEAEPLTGRTHQIRVHAAENGFPVLGDTLYGGTPFARVCLHAEELAFRHPVSGESMRFHAPADFDADPRLGLRTALIDPGQTDAFRLIHGASDGWPGWHVDRLGDFLLSESENLPTQDQQEILGLHLAKAARPAGEKAARTPRGVYHKTLTRQVRRTTPDESSPRLLLGQSAPDSFAIRENGVQFELRFNEGCSVGLFLDQRDNRRRLLTSHVAAEFSLFNSKLETRNSTSEVLNAFAYTCGFSVCAAMAGARTISLDLSKKYLEWGRRNFLLNHLDPAGHDFIYGDVFDWLRRMARKSRSFDVILLDPPTFSRSRDHGVFRVEKDYPVLVRAALPLLKPGGVLFASANAAGWRPELFLADVDAAVRGGGRTILQRHYVPQPPDFPVSRAEPAYLKTVWLRVS
jgi:23S rRNA (cytosine1962-C5)-methyltransferase